MKRVSLLSCALVIWGIFRSIVSSFFVSVSHPLFFFSPLESIVFVWSEVAGQSLFPVIWAASKSLGCGAHRHRKRKKRGEGSAHRKSTKLNINPGCRDRMALATEDKEGHCLFFCECRAAFWERGGGNKLPFVFLNCIIEAVSCIYYHSGVKNIIKKKVEGGKGGKR